MSISSVARIEGRAVPVRGNDIDTDRVIPARYLRCVTFDGLGEHAFEDDRKAGGHPFDDPRFQGASILVVNRNFGCGSSREHAPQSLMRWGIRAVIGESFAEIFRGNCTAMGIPCVTADGADVLLLMEAVEAEPGQAVVMDLRTKTVTYGDRAVKVQIPNSARSQLLEGAWDATGQLLEGTAAVRATAARLPYVSGFK
ncbi:MAG: isopropylmalate isomerase [Candidatus Handelsmanbacteria bacterium RIFCSPLOWO2_12_FULL_64_10]|uniref:3-isopropylmalate dehydratase n=1 Tax=Handelsmanbacteria sp. (strain RIFCSPLOWO2_12_FULL_64_10) TaxID=1817868 RepID=A0A1F6D340_HANXR|nr:MAG: isopropylmalate isomerase [Candidatus Handelsmanbacteria bacterium RIFCSPLOWO2_12_FULL_64_10]